MAYWDFWTHGASVQVEKAVPNQVVERAGMGAIVRQPGGTSNWFHFAIPTATQINGDYRVKHLDVYFKAKLNENVRIINVHVWVGDRRVIAKDGLDVRGPSVDYQLDIPNDLVRDKLGTGGGLLVCVGVEFLAGTPMGEITFTGAAARFGLV